MDLPTLRPPSPTARFSSPDPGSASSNEDRHSTGPPTPRPRRTTHEGMSAILNTGLDIRSSFGSPRLRAGSFSSRPLTTLSTDPALPNIARPSPALILSPSIDRHARPHAHADPRPRGVRSASVSSLERVARGSNIPIPSTADDSKAADPSWLDDERLWAPWESIARLGGLRADSSSTPRPSTSDDSSAEEPTTEPRDPPDHVVPRSRWSTLFAGKSAAAHARTLAHPLTAEEDRVASLEPSEPPSAVLSRIFSTAWFTDPASSSDPSASQPPSDSTGPSSSIVEERGKYTHPGRRSFTKPLHPLVLCHGLFGWSTMGPKDVPMLQINYWRGVKEALEEVGVEVYLASVPTTASIEERARTLAAFVEENLAGRTVNLIGHSMGGLDCRFLVSQLKPTTFKVASLTTIATPHRGSSFADYLLYDLISHKHLPKLLNLTSALSIPGGGQAYEQLTLSSMSRFNASTPDVPGIAYFSYGAAFEPGYTNVFRLPWGVIWEREGKNDGLVSVESAKWGEYQGTLENVNHLDLIGWIGPLRFAYADWTGKRIDFKPVSFFLDVADHLAKKGY